MLRVRIITAVIGLALLVTVASFGHIALGIAVFILALAGMSEFYGVVSNVGYKPVKFIGYLSCTVILFISMNGRMGRINFYMDLFKSINYFSFAIFILLVLLFCYAIFQHDKYSLIDIALTVFGMLYVVFLFSFVVLTRNLENGYLYFWLIFIGAWSTDTFAYFAGRIFGNHKLLPSISPKKTVEGAIGGMAGSILVTVLYGLIINRYIPPVPIYHYVVLGVLNGFLSQVGDWAASSIKRYVGIKDFGKSIPGHGGVLDRFDSLLFTAPVVYFYISFIVL